MFAGIDPLWTCTVLIVAALCTLTAFVVSDEDSRI